MQQLPLAAIAQARPINQTSSSAALTGPKLADAAHAQIGVTLIYDPRYQKLAYPGGDIPQIQGVCADVIVRAYRAHSIDLQVLVHEDMTRAWSDYPRLWPLKGPDANIDHRRVPNLATFFRRHGQSFPVSKDPASYWPGDIVTWRLPSGVPHVGMVANAKSTSKIPLVIHNIGRGTQQEDRLFAFTITGHYRYLPHS